jgi:WD40 repeat protein
MRLLKYPNAHFRQVAYTGAQSLLTFDLHAYLFRILLWNLARDAPPKELRPPQSDLAHLIFIPGGAGFLRTQGAWSEDDTPRSAVEVPRVTELLRVEGQPQWLPSAFGPDGTTVLYRHAGVLEGQYRTHFHLKQPDGTIRNLYQAWGMFTASAAFAPGGRLAAMSNGLREVSVWDVVEGREVFQLTQSDRVQALEFVSDEHLIVAAGRSVRLWDVTSGRTLAKYRAFRKFADALTVSHDRKLFAAGSRDGVVRLWDTATGRELKEYTWDVGQVNEIAFSPDGATAAAAGVSAVAVWDLD